MIFRVRRRTFKIESYSMLEILKFIKLTNFGRS
jgi:hypothetical protein